MNGNAGIIALDADGVLIDYHASYCLAWEKAFGVLPPILDAQAYWPMDRFDVRRLDGAELAHFRTFFDEAFWSEIPALPGAVEACQSLAAAGYELVCVSAVDARFQDARLRNLQAHGFPISRVIATSNSVTGESPKSAALRELRPLAFVDDFLPYFRGIPVDVHAALVMREPNGSPNIGPDLSLVHSQHEDLASFAKEWLA